MLNTITIAEIKRNGMNAIESGLQNGPLHLLKRNKAEVVLLSEKEYQRLQNMQNEAAAMCSVAPLEWLTNLSNAKTRTKKQIDSALKKERDW